MLCLELLKLVPTSPLKILRAPTFGDIARLSKTAFDVDFGQRRYGLVPPIAVDDPQQLLKKKKPTRVRASSKQLEILRAKCTCVGKHFRCMGSVKSKSGTWVSVAKSAGYHPPSLVKAWASAAADAAVTDLTK